MSKRLALLPLALLLAACSSIPNSGPVVRGARIDVVRNDGYVRVIARPPRDGMAPDALVRGFLAACASLPDGDDTARRYLTSGASVDWRPGSRTEVYDAAALTVTVERDDNVRITAPLLGVIDARRRYHVAAPGSTMTASLHVAQQDGQWRIDAAPEALYLGEGDVTRSLRSHPVYYLNGAGDRLVPEYVLLPAGAGNLASALVRQVLDGATSTALHSASPSDTTVLYASTQADIGTVTVALDRSVTVLSLQERQALLAQITWTLTALPNIFYVTVLVDGQSLVSTAGGASVSRNDFTAFDPGRTSRSHMLTYVRDDKVLALSGGIPRVVSSGNSVSQATVSQDGGTIVAVGANRKLLYVRQGGGKPRFVAAGGDLASPVFDIRDRAWYIDREAARGLFVWDDADGQRLVSTNLPERARILGFAIAPDGTRIALVVSEGATATVWVGAIVEQASDIRVVDLRRVEQRLTTAVAVAWSSESELAVLGAVGAVAVQPIGVTLPLGTLTLFGGPANTVSLAAVPGANMVVADQAGQLWQYANGKWSASELGTAPSYAH